MIERRFTAPVPALAFLLVGLSTSCDRGPVEPPEESRLAPEVVESVILTAEDARARVLPAVAAEEGDPASVRALGEAVSALERALEMRLASRIRVAAADVERALEAREWAEAASAADRDALRLFLGAVETALADPAQPH